MEYTILIVLLPLLTFLVLGLLGMKLKACASGLVGTLSMAVTTALAYGTAWQYFTTAKVDGIYQKWVPFNIECCVLPITCTSTWAYCSTRSR